MASNFYGAIALTGGAEGALDRIDGALLSDADGSICIDATNDKVYFHTLNSSSGAGESSPDIIVPDSNAGTKRWILVLTLSMSAFMRAILASTSISTFFTNIGLAKDWLWLPAKAWTPTITNGCATAADYEYVTNDIMVSYLAFDGATEEFASYNRPMQPTWDRGTVKARFLVIPATGCSVGDKYEFELAAVAGSDDDAVDTAAAGNQVITDTVLAGEEGDWHWTSATPAITIAGTPALLDVIHWKVSRNVGSANDDMVEDAWLIGVLIEFGISNSVTGW